MNPRRSARLFPSWWLPAVLAVLVAACGGTRPQPPAPVVVAPAPAPAKLPDPVLPPLRIGLALGGGAAKGFAHIGVI